MRKRKYFGSLIIAFMCLFACDDILEEDITNDTIQILSPLSGEVVEGNNVQFSWNVLDGADDYRIQVINDAQFTVLDSLVATNSFSYTLNSGIYEWRVRGENFAYNSAFSFTAEFSVEISEDLSNQVVVLQTPSIDFYTNDANILFTWNVVESASSYGYELQKNLNGLQTLVQENISTTNYDLDASLLDEDAEYIWKVKALNSTSETVFSERSFFLDRVAPNQPSLVTPIDMETTTSSVNFNWTNGTDTGNVQSLITNTIEISNDIDFNSVVTTDTTINNSYQFTFAENGTYYWRVKASDATNNESDFSAVRSLIVQ